VSALWLSLTLGLVAGLADCLGGFLLVRQSPSARALRYFVALGAGFMLAAAVLEMIPEGLRVNPRFAPLLILIGLIWLIVYIVRRNRYQFPAYPQGRGY